MSFISALFCAQSASRFTESSVGQPVGHGTGRYIAFPPGRALHSDLSLSPSSPSLPAVALTSECTEQPQSNDQAMSTLCADRRPICAACIALRVGTTLRVRYIQFPGSCAGRGAWKAHSHSVPSLQYIRLRSPRDAHDAKPLHDIRTADTAARDDVPRRTSTSTQRVPTDTRLVLRRVLLCAVLSGLLRGLL